MIPESPNWDLGRCRREGKNQDDFFIKGAKLQAEVAKFCSPCEIRPNCAAFALKMKERHGVWGGLTELERSKILRYPGSHQVTGVGVVNVSASGSVSINLLGQSGHLY